MSYGMLSGKYDSTKQRAVLLNGDRLRNYRRYNATLRMEILLTGGIILTDSQFLDGLYFLWITQHEREYDHFRDCFKTADRRTPKKYLDVKCRVDKEYENDAYHFPNKDDVAKNIFGKEFYNSSIELKELAQYVYELSKDYKETEIPVTCLTAPKKLQKQKDKSRVREFPESLKAYAKETENYLKALYGAYVSKAWTEYTEHVEKLFDYELGRWGFVSPEDNEKWINNYQIGSVLRQEVYGSKNAGETYLDKLYNLLEDIRSIVSNVTTRKYFTQIENELKNDMNTRSVITDSFDKIVYIMNNDSHIIQPDKEKATEYIEEFKCIMNDRYNKAFAYQHGCKFVDMCDYPKQLEILSKQVDVSEKACVLDEATVSKLGTMSWNSFKTVLNDLQPDMDKWLLAYDKHMSDGNDEELLKCFDMYMHRITEVLNSITVDHPAPSGPWNYKNTQNTDTIYKDILEKHCKYSFVGGGSFNEKKEGNEICILCPGNVEDKAMILRIRTMQIDQCDKNYDTMIAPVENDYNGGKIDDYEKN